VVNNFKWRTYIESLPKQSIDKGHYQNLRDGEGYITCTFHASVITMKTAMTR
jgi:hypothetical protein